MPLTAAISASLMLGVLVLVPLLTGGLDPAQLSDMFFLSRTLELSTSFTDSGGTVGPAIFFYSAFFTSIGLWLYAASVLVSRVLLRMNAGVGFLLRVTDVEEQPFRSMGLVSVIIVSALFALGLPLVLL